MDILQFYQDYGIRCMTEGHKHCRPGFVNTPCPFCTGNEGLHLSFNLTNNYFVCWRCGWHSVPNTIAKLLNVNYQSAKEIAKQYGSYNSISTQAKVIIHKKAFRLPSHSLPLQKNHKQYLEKRGFDPDKLEKQWGLLGTGPVSTLDKLSYKHRIIIPFVWNNEQVSFDSRDITGKALNKYQACPLEREFIPHKEIIYGNPKSWGSIGICVEGPTDVWRMGDLSFATSGIKFTPKQIRTISKIFKRVAVCFDGPSETSKELEAYNQANILVSELRFRGVDAFRVDIKGDPGSLPQSEADYLVKQLTR